MADHSFAQMIARRRQALGLSQQEVADRMREHGVGVSHQTIWKWENGATSPRQDRLDALAAALVLASETITAWWLGTDASAGPRRGVGSPWEGLFDELSDGARAAIEHIVALDRAARAASSRPPSGQRGGTRQDARPPAPHPQLDL